MRKRNKQRKKRQTHETNPTTKPPSWDFSSEGSVVINGILKDHLGLCVFQRQQVILEKAVATHCIGPPAPDSSSPCSDQTPKRTAKLPAGSGCSQGETAELQCSQPTQWHSLKSALHSRIPALGIRSMAVTYSIPFHMCTKGSILLHLQMGEVRHRGLNQFSPPSSLPRSRDSVQMPLPLGTCNTSPHCLRQPKIKP